jgi:hypothetical protein
MRQLVTSGKLSNNVDTIGTCSMCVVTSRGGPIALPRRSPDVTPLDFFLWGYVKNIVYQVKTNDLQHLKARIRDAVGMVTPNMLQATWDEVKYCLEICRATKGVHIEIY